MAATRHVACTIPLQIQRLEGSGVQSASIRLEEFLSKTLDNRLSVLGPGEPTPSPLQGGVRNRASSHETWRKTMVDDRAGGYCGALLPSCVMPPLPHSSPRV